MHRSRRDSHMALGARGRAITPSAIEESLAAIRRAGPGTISLANGSPAAEDLPRQFIAEALASAAQDPGSLDYGPPRGEPALLTAIDDFHSSLGVPPRPTLVCSGATQGLYMALFTLASPGDVVLTDTATYCDTLTACRSLGLRAIGVPHDRDGMLPNALAQTVDEMSRRGYRPAAVCLIPTAHNPLGLTLSAERRKAIVNAARSTDLTIIEDDTYVLFDEAGAIPTLAALAPELVVRLDTVSKVLGPGLRIGWISGPSEVMAAIEMLKASVDVCAPVLLQRTVASLLPRIRALSQPQMDGLVTRRAALLDALDEHFVASATWTRPRGGYFVWFKPADRRPSRELVSQALAMGVAVLPGYIFSPDGRDEAIRLSYAGRSPAELREGVARLRAVTQGS